MEINSYSANFFYQTSSKHRNKNSADDVYSRFELYLSSNDKTTTTTTMSPKKDSIVDIESVEFQRYSCYPNDLEMKIKSFQEHKFYEAQEQLPYEKRLAHPEMLYPNSIFSEENMTQLKINEPDKYQWVTELTTVTNEDKYDGAPEYKAFVDKWVKKGLSEFEALTHAESYVTAGLLDYGSQRADFMMWDMPPTDTKQHGMWLINNQPLRIAMIETFDSLDIVQLSSLVSTIFYGTPEEQNIDMSFSFQTLLEKYGVKLEDLKQKDPQFAKENPEVFSGDINLKNDNSAESQAYNNFIFKTIVGFFKDRIESLERWEYNHNEDDLSSTKKSINLLIDNFQEKVDEYNENITNGKSIGKK